jgi:hypothetical protein
VEPAAGGGSVFWFTVPGVDTSQLRGSKHE